MAADKVLTPAWAQRQLPEGVEVVRIRGRWYLILWTDEHCVAQADPEKWAYSNGELGESQELEAWIPLRRHIKELVDDLTESLLADENAAKKDPAKETANATS